MVKRIVRHNKILRYNSDNNVVGYDYTPIAEFVVEGHGVGESQVDVVKDIGVNFTNLSTNTTSWLWNFGSTATPTTSTQENPTGITYSTTGVTETVTLISYNSLSNDIKTRTNYINVLPLQGKALYLDMNTLPASGERTERTWTPSGGTEITATFNNFPTRFNLDAPSGKTIYYEDNTISPYYFGVESPFNVEYNNGTNQPGVYPAACILQNFASWYDTTPVCVISGLTTSITYKLVFFGNRDSWEATTRYTIADGTSKDGNYVDLNTNSNLHNTVEVAGITPSSGGTIKFTTFWQNSQAFLNVLKIVEGE